MKKIIATIICVAVLAFVAVAQANQVRFLSRTSEGVAPSQDVHYTVMDLNGNKVAEESVVAAEGEGVTINNLPAGTYFISAEQTSTGYFGSVTTEVVAQEAAEGEDSEIKPVDLVLGSDGLQVYNPNAAQPVAPASKAVTPTYGAPTTSNVPGTIPGYYYDAPNMAGGRLTGGRLGALALIAGVALGSVGIALAAASKEAK